MTGRSIDLQRGRIKQWIEIKWLLLRTMKKASSCCIYTLLPSSMRMLLGWFMVLNATFNNISAISWWSVLLVEETGVPGENHQPIASQCHINVTYCCIEYTSLWKGFEFTTLVVIGTDCTGSCNSNAICLYCQIWLVTILCKILNLQVVTNGPAGSIRHL